MKGSTGTSLGSKAKPMFPQTKKSCDRLAKTLRQEMKVISLHNLDARCEHGQIQNARASLVKQLARARARNDLDRASMDMEFIHTLVSGLKPVRHQMMTVLQARKLNAFNRQNDIPFLWVMGKQSISEGK